MNVTIAPLSIEYQQDQGLVEINTEFTEGLAYGLEKMLSRLFGYYQYRQVTLRINSPGGNLQALKYILSVVRQARLRGLQVRTEATFMAASAGALLLSHGQVGSRTAQVLTQLLYHHTRVAGATPALTSSAADMLSHAMKRNDAKLICGLVAHVEAGLGSVQTLCLEGQARCTLLQHQQVQIARELDLDNTKPPKWLGAVAKVYRECAQRNSTAPLQKFLEARFTPDTGMDLQEAYALLLVDRVLLAPALPAHARLQAEPTADLQAPLKLAA